MTPECSPLTPSLSPKGRGRHIVGRRKQRKSGKVSILNIHNTIYLLNTVMPVFFISSASIPPLLKSSGLKGIGSMRLSVLPTPCFIVKIQKKFSLDYSSIIWLDFIVIFFGRIEIW